jgi:exopolysaccharide biosynthesis polyprenyl glycosylphosphotransferase
VNPRIERIALVVIDTVTMCLAWTIYFWFRVESGLMVVSPRPDFLVPMVVVACFWLLLFFIVGLYKPWYAASRFDEVALLFKTIVVGVVILFFVVFIDDEGTAPGSNSRLLIAIYWAVLFVSVVAGRMLLRSIQRRMLIAGIGAHNTLIVGSRVRSRDLYDEVVKFPALGYRVVGAVRIDKAEKKKPSQPTHGLRTLGGLTELPKLIERHGIKEVLIALDSKDHNRLIDIIARCGGYPVGLKIVPDLYDIISGQARTNQIYGFPLIEISPEIMPPWEEAVKRIMDIGAALLALVVGLPLWLIIAVIIKVETPGPVLYKQERVGKDGERFNIIKFRSMVVDAEKAGPQWAHKRDPRVTRVGWLLRKLHLDEIPQFWNVLSGHMSLVGPRPERPVFVAQLSREIPLYPRRLKVRPGITGWAQVKHTYDESIDDVRKKVQYDLFYIENMSLRMDMKILFSTVSHMLLWRGR